MQQALYVPDPDPKRIASTRAALFHRRDGESRTAFCVDRKGKTVAVRTIKRFPGDPQIDLISRETIKTWRFKPFVVSGRRARVCSVAIFKFKFTK